MPPKAVSAAAGCFGKLPGRGDFLRRGLDGAWVERLDGWLAPALSASRAALGAEWQELYLTAPVWSFVVGAGAAGGHARAGVLCPSADRVGRCYPLVISAPFAAGPDAPDAATWFARAEAAAIAAVEERLSPEAFLERLDEIGAPCPEHAADRVMTGALQPLALAPAVAGGGCGLWWSAGSHRVAPAVLLCAHGFPEPGHVAAMLDGAWGDHGWADAGACLTEAAG